MRLPGAHALLFLLCLGLSASAGAQNAAPSAGTLNTVESIRHGVLSGGRTVVQISFAREISERPQVVAMHSPRANITLDFADSASSLSKEPIQINLRDLRDVRVFAGGNRVRVVLNLNRPVPYDVEISGRDAHVMLHAPVAGAGG